MPPTHQAVLWLPGGRRYQSPREPPVDRREELVSLSALALLLPQASQAHSRAQAVLSLGSDQRGDIVDLDEDACPLPVGVSKAGEAIFDQLPAGRTLGGTIGRERGSRRPCSGRSCTRWLRIII